MNSSYLKMKIKLLFYKGKGNKGKGNVDWKHHDAVNMLIVKNVWINMIKCILFQEQMRNGYVYIASLSVIRKERMSAFQLTSR